MLAGAGVFRLLRDDDLILIQLLRKGERRRKARVARGALFHALKRGKRLGDVEHLALLHGDVAIHVAERARCAARHVAVIRVGRVRHAEAGVRGGEGLAVELCVARHAEAAEVDGRRHDLCVAAGLFEAARGAGQVAAARVCADDHIRVAAIALFELMPKLPAERFHAAHAEGGIERGVEIAGLFQHHEHFIEQLRADGKLEHFRAERFALARLFDDLRLAALLGVVAFLHDDALEALHRRLGSHSRAVVAARRGDDALVAHLLCMVDARGRAALLEAARRVRSFILHKDARALAGLCIFAGKRRQVVQFEDRGVAHVEFPLDADVILKRIAGAVHQRFIVEGDGAGFILAVIDAHGLFYDLALAAGDSLVALVYDHAVYHASSPPNSALRRDSSIVRISGTNAP